ncbi:hypothetical protein [Okeania sp. SIO2B3]|uniref:hypothetical protein n=1 Tax=Okeania sp. SIO2B3 TaxID=2607784 RepID=UPI0013C0E6E0|nr:hypothetical protein [Okeania sp. SIO2B3]NET44372.1 hypothetical protein [Okeania sp. SIO2B3]
MKVESKKKSSDRLPENSQTTQTKAFSKELPKKATPKVELGLPFQTNCDKLISRWVTRLCTRLFIQHKKYTKTEKTPFVYHTNNLLSKQQKTTKEKLVILSKENSDKDRARQQQNRN